MNATYENAKPTLPKGTETPSRLWAFELRDIVFAAVIAAGILLIGFVTIPLVLHIPIPGIRNIVSAPLSAVFITIAAARIQKRFSLLLVVGLCSLVYVLVSPVIPAFTISAGIIAEAVNLLFFKGYSTRRSRLFCVTILYTVMTPLGTLWGACLLGGQYQESLTKVHILLPVTAAVLATTLVGALLGEKIVSELRRAGKLA